MSHFRDKELRAVQAFLRAVYGCRRVEQFAQTVITELPRLVGADQTTWNDVAPSVGRVQVMANPEEQDHESRRAALARHIGEHPLMLHYWSTGDPSAVKVSDFMSAEEFHRTALYDELYHELGYEDHFVMHLTPPGPTDLVAVLGRGQRSFSERDRELLNLVRPHIGQAYRTARAFHRLLRCLEENVAVRPRQARMLVSSEGEILCCPRRAQRWLYTYFRDQLPRSPKRLPEVLERWLALQRQGGFSGAPPLAAKGPASSRFQRKLRNRRLHLHVEQANSGSALVLYLEEQTTLAAEQEYQTLGLTRREAEVLRQVERGLTNLEIATLLSISENTVKRHLEHIFAKLGVHTRTAAVARLRPSS